MVKGFRHPISDGWTMKCVLAIVGLVLACTSAPDHSGALQSTARAPSLCEFEPVDTAGWEVDSALAEFHYRRPAGYRRVTYSGPRVEIGSVDTADIAFRIPAQTWRERGDRPARFSVQFSRDSLVQTQEGIYERRVTECRAPRMPGSLTHLIAYEFHDSSASNSEQRIQYHLAGRLRTSHPYFATFWGTAWSREELAVLMEILRTFTPTADSESQPSGNG
jgi:hypothetical protein